MIKQRFQIEGMHCVGCAMTVDGALEDLPGVKSASTNYAKQFADVEYDERKITEAHIVQAIKEAGYTGKPLPAQN
ncbi:MAG: heavy-metal-associated domain-containing protein [Anaerolineae bacterium]|nr:heavy-metal-associated domain-containing protein [Anaerolineae bacterium]